MNRTIFISIVGLGVLSAAGFAGSRAQSASIATCRSTAPSTPVVVVTQPDGNRHVATCVSVSACDPSAKSRGASTVYTFSPQQGGTAAVTASGSGAACGIRQAQAGTCSTTSSAACVAGSGSTVSTTTGDNVLGQRFALRAPQQGEPAVVHLPSTAAVEIQSPFGVQSLLAAQHPQQRVYSFDLSEGTLTPLSPSEDDDVTAEWHVEAERALAEARESLSENQDEMREAWQRAAEEARVAQERAREVYDQAMETYRDAMRKAQERSREAQDRANAERRAQADRGARKSARAGMRSDTDARSNVNRRSSPASPLLRRPRAAGVSRSIPTARSRSASRGRTHARATCRSCPNSSRVRMPANRRRHPSRRRGPPRPGEAEGAAPVAPAAPGIPAPPHKGTPGQTPAQPPTQPFMLRRADPEGGAHGWFAKKPMSDDDREQMTRAMDDLKREAARLREELARMRAEVERLPRSDGGR